jgi:hypothetical protein
MNEKRIFKFFCLPLRLSSQGTAVKMLIKHYFLVAELLFKLMDDWVTMQMGLGQFT